MSDSTLRPMGERRFGRWNVLGTQTLAMREIRRFTSVWTQTLLAPMATALLFMLIFTLALGDRRGEVMGLEFAAFLAPGIVMMTVIQNAFANTSSSIVISKVQGNIVDTLMPPLSASELVVGFAAGGMVRGMLVAVFVSLLALPLGGAGLDNVLWAFVFVFLGAMMMSLVGIIAGLYADKFDQMAAITNFVVTPLSFLSGTFYSLESLPPLMQQISHANPVFYIIDGFRYGVLGVSDSSPWLGLSVLIAMNAALATAAWWFFRTGYRLKS
ncbi:ABC transporter permease [Pontivivens insulae]|uniref:Transport permease protein n=1 Tax=Pontivivens insulae TaxID=1639689 RepID=A0A2R8A785_9RHOB|nr:ABC transporter permease [Pontivivens insulae]RED18159.1 ABC-2 type transport system permease protein [Pontivivens insulae]SPF28056.1 Inner membrane transport permease YadH [Pontivivens insulae]